MPTPSLHLGFVICVEARDQKSRKPLLFRVQPLLESHRSVPREDLIKDIMNGGELHTIYLKDGRQTLGARLHQVQGQYLRTDSNEVLADNLAELPDCADVPYL